MVQAGSPILQQARKQAAVDPVVAAGHERGVIAGQEQNQLGHLFRLTNPPDGMQVSPIFDHLRGIVRAEEVRGHIQHRRVDGARRDAIAANVFPGVIKRDGRGKTGDRSFGSRIGRDRLL